MAKQSGWVTINGVHVFIDGKSGKITQGPAKFIGSTLNDLPSNKSSQAELKARLQAKKAEKSPASKAMAKAKSDREVEPSKNKKSDGLVERAKRQTAKSSASDTSKTGNSNFDNATSTTKAKVAKNPNNRLHTGRISSKGDLTPKQHKLFIQYVGSSGKGMSGNEALKIAISGKIPAVASTSSRQSNSARVSNAKTRGEFLRAVHDPVITARTRKRGK